MGISDFLAAVGDGIEKINRWTSLAPSGLDQKPLLSISGEGIGFNEPFSTKLTKTSPEDKAEGLNLGIEQALTAMRWTYDNGVSQPLSTALLMGKQGRRGDDDPFGFSADYFSSEKWGKAWEAANHISIGQAAVLNKDEAQRAIGSPLLYYKPAEAYLPPGFGNLPEDQQQELLREAGMPAVGNAFIQQERENSTWFKYGTGAIDFGSVVFLDPTMLALGAAGRARASTQIMKRPKTGWSPQDIDAIMAKGTTQKLVDGIWANRDNPQLLNNTTMARRSAMGPRFGAIVSTLNDPQELTLFVRTGMGDVRAMEELAARNHAAGVRMKNDIARTSALDLMRARWSNNPAVMQMIELETQRLTAAKNADAGLIQRYDEVLRQADQLDELNISRWSLERAKERTNAQNEYLTGPARGADRPVVLRPTTGPLQLRGGRAGLPQTPISTGYTSTTLWGAGDFFSGPVTLVRMLKNASPNGYMRIDTLEADAVNELRSHLSRIPGIKEETRGNILNSYLKTTTEAERKSLLEDVGRIGAAKVAEKHGMEPEFGAELYRQHTKFKQGEVDNMQRYSAALRPPEEVAAGQQLHIDEFTDQGGKLVVEPFTATRLMNGHTFQNLDEMDKIFRRHGSALKAIRTSTGSVYDAVKASADYLTYLWKFSTLFRLGYIPRVLGDDLAGQTARLGVASMVLRGYRGAKNTIGNVATFAARPALATREAVAREGVEYANQEMALLVPDIRKWEGRIASEERFRRRDVAMAQQRLNRALARQQNLPASATPAQRGAVDQFVQAKRNEAIRANARANQPVWPARKQQLDIWKDQHDFLTRHRDVAQKAADDYAAKQQMAKQGTKTFDIDGHTFPAAFGGKDGEYYLAQISADDSVGNIFNTNKAILQGNFERSFNHGAKPVSAAQAPKEHLEAWTHAINNQIMQDPLQRMIVSGQIATPEAATHWMTNTAQGMAYRKRLPKMIQTEDIARSQFHEVDQYLPSPELRMKAMEPDGVNPAWLDEAFPLNSGGRPDVHIGQIGQSQLHHANTMDRVIQGWFKFAATMPANTMSRHPLFNQLYEGHLKSIVNTRAKAGVTQHTVEDVEKMATSARALALKDTRKLVFDIAHRSDVASALRFTSPFFSATAESFQRWGRIIADRPAVVGYAGSWYNAPLGAGAMQDMDGNQILPNGKSFDSATGKWRDVPKSERYIVTRVPKWVADSPLGKAFNITEAGGKLSLSQNSMNMVTQGDPWFNPGVGPIVQVPVAEFVKDKPRNAEMARELGILPFGPPTGGPVDRLMQQVAPKTVRDFITAYDTSDQRYQQIKMQIMQRSIFEHETQGKRMLTPQEIADKTKRYWLFSASSAFLQPVATQRKDPYQFFRDQYNNLRRNDPKTADDQFLERYGESYFIFAQEITKSQGVAPTIKALDLAKKWGPLIAKNPEMAALIIGPDGDGPFSREAYAYELNHPLVPGGGEMMRSKITADQAMKENQRRLGWAKFTKKMNSLTAGLHKAGFSSFEDPGAEEFLADKKAWTKVYSEPLYPDGTVNPDYNEEWSKDYLSFDPRKYERMIPALTNLARSDLAKQANRSDLRVLGEYLGGRQALVEQLSQLKAAGEPSTLAAKKNAALRYQWVTFVDSLIESDTRFGDLHSRYLSRDLGVDAEEEAEEVTE